MTPRTFSYVAALLLCATATSSTAEEGANEDIVKRKEERQKASFANVKAPSTVSPNSAPGYDLTLEGTTTEKTATASATWTRGDGSEVFGLNLSGPLNEETGDATPLDFNGLKGSASIGIEYHRFLWPGGINPRLEDLLCDAIGKNSDENCDRANFREHNKGIVKDLREMYDRAGAKDKAVLCTLVREPCERNGFEAVDLDRAFLKANGLGAAAWIFGFVGEAARASFKFLAEDTLTPGKEQHNNWSFGARFGRYSPKDGYFAANVKYKQEYSAADDAKNLCIPLGETGATECKDAVIGPPTNEKGWTANLEWRKFVSGGKFAINPRVQRDFAAKVTSVDIPMYFFGADKGLTGGVRTGWRSDTKDITFSVFVGASALTIHGN